MSSSRTSSSNEVDRLREDNVRLEHENTAMKSDLYFKHIRIETLKSHLWDRSNELVEVQSQVGWYQEKLKILERTIFDKNRMIQGKSWGVSVSDFCHFCFFE